MNEGLSAGFEGFSFCRWGSCTCAQKSNSPASTVHVGGTDLITKVGVKAETCTCNRLCNRLQRENRHDLVRNNQRCYLVYPPVDTVPGTVVGPRSVFHRAASK